MFGDAIETSLKPKSVGGEGFSAEGPGSKVLWAVVVKECHQQPSLSTDQSEHTPGSDICPPPAGQALTINPAASGLGRRGGPPPPGPEKAHVGKDAWGGGALSSACAPVWTSISILRMQCGTGASQPQVPGIPQSVVPMLTPEAKCSCLS